MTITSAPSPLEPSAHWSLCLQCELFLHGMVWFFCAFLLKRQRFSSYGKPHLGKENSILLKSQVWRIQGVILKKKKLNSFSWSGCKHLEVASLRQDDCVFCCVIAQCNVQGKVVYNSFCRLKGHSLLHTSAPWSCFSVSRV